MPENKWQEFESSHYRLQDLGRTAVFLIPLKKLRQEIDGTTVEEHLHQFLTKNFGAYGFLSVPSSGVWIGPDQVIMFDESRRYEVAFVGKSRLPFILDELARLAVLIGEKCIYFAAGQYVCLVWPR